MYIYIPSLTPSSDLTLLTLHTRPISPTRHRIRPQIRRRLRKPNRPLAIRTRPIRRPIPKSNIHPQTRR